MSNLKIKKHKSFVIIQVLLFSITIEVIILAIVSLIIKF